MGVNGRGAYGFRLVPPAHEAELPDLTSLDRGAPMVTLVWQHAAMLAERRLVDENRVSLAWRRGSMLEVRRNPPLISLAFPDAPTPELLVHPLLTGPMSILARWRGDLTLHAGSFYANGLAWAVLGAKATGKSTMLAMLGKGGYPLLADDLLVLDDGVVRSGPACVDLRPDAAERVPEARFIGELNERPRFRLSMPIGPARAELAGLFLLDWSENTVSVESVSAGESLRIVYEHEYMGLLGPANPGKVLDLLKIPMWRIRRPREWSANDEAIDRILEITTRRSA